MTQFNNANPVNFITGKPYMGEKADELQLAALEKGYTSNEWATMNQWNSSKRSIAKGEKGTPVKYARILESDEGPVKVEETTYLFNRCQLARLTNN